jgi:hypothetical protein
MRALHRLGTIGVTTALAGASLLGTAGVASAATPAPSTPTVPTPEPTTCPAGALPVEVIGADGVKAQNALGVYLWHGKTGYALRVTHPGHQKVTFTGTITVSNKISAVRKFRLEKADSMKVGPQRHTLTFRFTNYGYLDGISFAAGCSRDVKVTVSIDGKQAAPDQVFLGKNRLHPTSVPFTIERTRVATPA